MINVGGSSYSNGIKFQSEKYTINFVSSKDTTEIFLSKKRKTTITILNFMRRIPLLRGLTLYLEDFNLLFIFMILFDIMKSRISINNMKSSSSAYTSIYNILILISIIIFIKITYELIKILKKLKSTWMYHGAEHKVIYTNYENKEINLENCRKASRVSDNCGTMFVVLFIFISIITKIVISTLNLNTYITLQLLVPFILAYELFLLKRTTPVINILFKLGYFLQEHIFTLEPTDIQLNQAIETFKLLEDDEIKDLINNGKKIKL